MNITVLTCQLFGSTILVWCGHNPTQVNQARTMAPREDLGGLELSLQVRSDTYIIVVRRMFIDYFPSRLYLSGGGMSRIQEDINVSRIPKVIKTALNKLRPKSKDCTSQTGI